MRIARGSPAGETARSEAGAYCILVALHQALHVAYCLNQTSCIHHTVAYLYSREREREACSIKLLVFSLTLLVAREIRVQCQTLRSLIGLILV
jgi:hypothetical protein